MLIKKDGVSSTPSFFANGSKQRIWTYFTGSQVTLLSVVVQV